MQDWIDLWRDIIASQREWVEHQKEFIRVMRKALKEADRD